MASENIRPNSNYTVSVSVHDRFEPTTLKLSIEDDDETIAEDEITFMASGTEILQLAIDDISVNNNIRFVVNGTAGLIFDEESILNVESKNCSIFIQTDKSIYKPSETIHIRVLVLDFDLKPYQLDDSEYLKVSITVNIQDARCQPSDIHFYGAFSTHRPHLFIQDAAKNRIKQWKTAQLNTGVLESDLSLSDAPVLGDWTITADLNDEVTFFDSNSFCAPFDP